VLHGGEPVAGALVIVMPDDAESLAAMKMKTTGDEGRFDLTLDHPGEITISIQQGAGLGQQNNVERREQIPDGATEHELVIELPLGRISGRVLGPDGDPLPDARVTLHKEGGVPVGSFLGTRYADTTTDAEGRYDLLYVDPGVYTVGAGGVMMGGALGGESAGGRVLKSGLAIADGQWLDRVDFRLKTPGTLRGRVVDAAGLPAPEATVFLRDGEGRLLESFSMLATDATGRFTVDSLAPGTYTVHARDASRASADAAPVQIQPGLTAETTVTLTPGTVLVITVVDASDEDVKATVRAEDGEGRDVGMMRSMTEMLALLALDPDERKHRLGPLPPGKYAVTAVTDDGREASRPVTLNGQAERKVKLRVR
jgi:protocatechuate 3,4-dioxygenase beta subunit